MNDRFDSLASIRGNIGRNKIGTRRLSCPPEKNPALDQSEYCDQEETHSDGRTMTKPRRILLPINIAKCPLEVFSDVNKFAGDPPATITLLHVVKGKTPDAIGLAAVEKHLENLARKFINPRLSPRLCVRVGEPALGILAEVNESNADLIVLTSYQDLSVWNRPLRPGIVGEVLSAEPCAISLLHVRTHFNCEEQWEVVDEIVAALDYVGLLRSVKP